MADEPKLLAKRKPKPLRSSAWWDRVIADAGRKLSLSIERTDRLREAVIVLRELKRTDLEYNHARRT